MLYIFLEGLGACLPRKVLVTRCIWILVCFRHSADQLVKGGILSAGIPGCFPLPPCMKNISYSDSPVSLYGMLNLEIMEKEIVVCTFLVHLYNVVIILKVVLNVVFFFLNLFLVGCIQS